MGSQYDPRKSYLENYASCPLPVPGDLPAVPGNWEFCGLPVESPIGISAGPLLHGDWCLYYASLGFDVVTYKTVRSSHRACYPMPNLVAVNARELSGPDTRVSAVDSMKGSWAVSFGMPSMTPERWRADIERTRKNLSPEKVLSVSVVGTMKPGWGIEELADDYALCAKWVVESGADTVEVNFSCPNVATRDGQLCQLPEEAALVARRVRDSIATTPLIVKIGVIEKVKIPSLVQALDPLADALAMTNSVPATVLDADGQTMFEGQSRGICGAATLKYSVQQVSDFRSAIEAADSRLKIIGVGGVFSVEDVMQYLDAGAQNVHMATSAMLDPLIGIKIRGSTEWASVNGLNAN